MESYTEDSLSNIDDLNRLMNVCGIPLGLDGPDGLVDDEHAIFLKKADFTDKQEWVLPRNDTTPVPSVVVNPSVESAIVSSSQSTFEQPTTTFQTQPSEMPFRINVRPSRPAVLLTTSRRITSPFEIGQGPVVELSIGGASSDDRRIGGKIRRTRKPKRQLEKNTPEYNAQRSRNNEAVRKSRAKKSESVNSAICENAILKYKEQQWENEKVILLAENEDLKQKIKTLQQLNTEHQREKLEIAIKQNSDLRAINLQLQLKVRAAMAEKDVNNLRNFFTDLLDRTKYDEEQLREIRNKLLGIQTQ